MPFHRASCHLGGGRWLPRTGRILCKLGDIFQTLGTLYNTILSLPYAAICLAGSDQSLGGTPFFQGSHICGPSTEPILCNLRGTWRCRYMAPLGLANCAPTQAAVWSPHPSCSAREKEWYFPGHSGQTGAHWTWGSRHELSEHGGTGWQSESHHLGTQK